MMRDRLGRIKAMFDTPLNRPDKPTPFMKARMDANGRWRIRLEHPETGKALFVSAIDMSWPTRDEAEYWATEIIGGNAPELRREGD